MDIVENTVFIHIIRDFKLVPVLIAEAECYTGIDDRLTVQDILEKFLGNVYIRKDLKVGSPFDRRACLFTVGRAYGELLTFFADYLALLEVQLIFFTVTPDGDIHVFRGVLRCARAEAVKTERVFVVLTLVVRILAACVQLAENELPVKALLICVPVDRASSSEVLDLYRFIGIAGQRYEIAVTLTSLVNGV